MVHHCITDEIRSFLVNEGILIKTDNGGGTLMPRAINTQSTLIEIIEKFYDHYKSKDNVMVIEYEPDMFDLLIEGYFIRLKGNVFGMRFAYLFHRDKPLYALQAITLCKDADWQSANMGWRAKLIADAKLTFENMLKHEQPK